MSMLSGRVLKPTLTLSSHSLGGPAAWTSIRVWVSRVEEEASPRSRATSVLSSPTVASKEGSLTTPFSAPDTLMRHSCSAMQQ